MATVLLGRNWRMAVTGFDVNPFPTVLSVYAGGGDFDVLRDTLPLLRA